MNKASEKRLIDANEYCRELYRERDYPGRTQEFMDAIEVAIADLCDMPTVDAVEVVRCKDCKHWLKDVPGCTDFIGHCEWGNYMIGAAGYCVYGERKDDAVSEM